MSEKKYCKLIMVTARNNNKWYEMQWDGVSSDFVVNFGRVESGHQTASYPISKWNSKYNEKINKGYQDVTAMVTVNSSTNGQAKGGDGVVGITDKKVAEFMQLMLSYTTGLIDKTYSVKAENVTAAQIDKAQGIIDQLMLCKTCPLQDTNDLLVSLYTIIPRKMRNVMDHLVPSISLERVLEQEQDNLDAMSSQVARIAPKSKKVKSGSGNILDDLGLVMKTIQTNQDLKYLTDQVGGRTRVEGIFAVEKEVEDKVFDTWLKKQKNKQTKILIHGTRNTSVIPILRTNLQIRPAGSFQFSGKVYGNGNYFSETVNKSLNYTGNDRDKILLVYEVHTGNPFVYDGWFRGNSFKLDYPNLQQRGYDSTFVKAGGGLLNTEVICYKEEQNRIKYIIWLKS